VGEIWLDRLLQALPPSCYVFYSSSWEKADNSEKNAERQDAGIKGQKTQSQISLLVVD